MDQSEIKRILTYLTQLGQKIPQEILRIAKDDLESGLSEEQLNAYMNYFTRKGGKSGGLTEQQVRWYSKALHKGLPEKLIDSFIEFRLSEEEWNVYEQLFLAGQSAEELAEKIKLEQTVKSAEEQAERVREDIETHQNEIPEIYQNEMIHLSEELETLTGMLSSLISDMNILKEQSPPPVPEKEKIEKAEAGQIEELNRKVTVMQDGIMGMLAKMNVLEQKLEVRTEERQNQQDEGILPEEETTDRSDFWEEEKGEPEADSEEYYQDTPDAESVPEKTIVRPSIMSEQEEPMSVDFFAEGQEVVISHETNRKKKQWNLKESLLKKMLKSGFFEKKPKQNKKTSIASLLMRSKLSAEQLSVLGDGIQQGLEYEDVKMIIKSRPEVEVMEQYIRIGLLEKTKES